MSGVDDDQIRAALAHRSRAGLTEPERANILRAARLQALRPRRRLLPRFAGWLAAAAAVLILVVIAVPVLLSSPIPVARASSSPSPSAPSALPIYSGPQIAAMVGDPNWIGKTVLSNAVVAGHNGPGPACFFGQPCFIGTLDGLITPVEVWADWRDALPGEGAAVASDGQTRWLSEVGLPSTSPIAAFRIERDYVVLLGPAQLDNGLPWQADALAKTASQQASDDVYVVSGWMLQAGPLSCPPPFDYPQTPPPALDWYCGGSWVTAAEHRSIFHDTPNSGHIDSRWADGVHGQNSAYDQFALNPGTDDQGSIPRYGTYLMRNAGCQAEAMGDCPVWRIVGRVDPGSPADVTAAPTVSPLVLKTADIGDISIDYPADWTFALGGNEGRYERVRAFITAPGAHATESCPPDFDPNTGGSCIDSYVLPSDSVLIVITEVDMPPDAQTAITQDLSNGWQSATLAGQPAAYNPNLSSGTTPAGMHGAAWLVAAPGGAGSVVRYLVTASDNGMSADLKQMVSTVVGSFRFVGQTQTGSPSPQLPKPRDPGVLLDPLPAGIVPHLTSDQAIQAAASALAGVGGTGTVLGVDVGVVALSQPQAGDVVWVVEVQGDGQSHPGGPACATADCTSAQLVVETATAVIDDQSGTLLSVSTTGHVTTPQPTLARPDVPTPSTVAVPMPRGIDLQQAIDLARPHVRSDMTVWGYAVGTYRSVLNMTAEAGQTLQPPDGTTWQTLVWGIVFEGDFDICPPPPADGTPRPCESRPGLSTVYLTYQDGTWLTTSGFSPSPGTPLPTPFYIVPLVGSPAPS